MMIGSIFSKLCRWAQGLCTQGRRADCACGCNKKYPQGSILYTADYDQRACKSQQSTRTRKTCRMRMLYRGESEVLGLIAEGMLNRRSPRSCLSAKTVKTVSNIFKKAASFDRHKQQFMLKHNIKVKLFSCFKTHGTTYLKFSLSNRAKDA